MADDSRVTRKQFLGGVAGAGAGGLVIGGVVGGFIGNAVGGDEGGGGQAQTAAGQAAAEKKTPYLIGSAYPITGDSAADGEQMKNGSTLAIKEINDSGGIAGRMIE